MVLTNGMGQFVWMMVATKAYSNPALSLNLNLNLNLNLYQGN